ncbi:uncharacterized protein HaLaN_19442 [Haematococcus lacustris]|uniref:S1 motif domain-containing protein n=1 Tax=Haematococcus lacustris TaxID=44745 RepID=A0A699ZIF2_HAELA|nr:uncharacterized protein HaLaN_19442 [Haematococcus lacustris]
MLQIGDVMVGEVHSVRPYGAFVDLGGFVGLLHRTQVSMYKFQDVHNILKKGDKLKVSGGCPVWWSKADCTEPASTAISAAGLQEGCGSWVQVQVFHLATTFTWCGCVRPRACAQVMILKYDQDKGRITLSTKKLEATPGDMLRDPRLVFDKAEEMAKAFKSQISTTTTKANTEDLHVTARLLASDALSLAIEAMPAQAIADTPQLLTTDCSSGGVGGPSLGKLLSDIATN